MTEHERDQRDVSILAMLDQGKTQAEVAALHGVTRGAIVRLTSQIRQDQKGGT